MYKKGGWPIETDHGWNLLNRQLKNFMELAWISKSWLEIYHWNNISLLKNPRHVRLFLVNHTLCRHMVRFEILMLKRMFNFSLLGKIMIEIKKNYDCPHVGMIYHTLISLISKNSKDVVIPKSPFLYKGVFLVINRLIFSLIWWMDLYVP